MTLSSPKLVSRYDPFSGVCEITDMNVVPPFNLVLYACSS